MERLIPPMKCELRELWDAHGNFVLALWNGVPVPLEYSSGDVDETESELIEDLPTHIRRRYEEAARRPKDRKEGLATTLADMLVRDLLHRQE